MTDEQGVTGGTGQHANRGEPNIRGTLGRISTVADAKHMGKGFKQSPGVLFGPMGTL